MLFESRILSEYIRVVQLKLAFAFKPKVVALKLHQTLGLIVGTNSYPDFNQRRAECCQRLIVKSIKNSCDR